MTSAPDIMTRERAEEIARKIAYGHSNEKHMDEFNAIGISSPDELSKKIADVMCSPATTEKIALERGRVEYCDYTNNIAVIYNPYDPDSGTAFIRGTKGRDFSDCDTHLIRMEKEKQRLYSENTNVFTSYPKREPAVCVDEKPHEKELPQTVTAQQESKQEQDGGMLAAGVFGASKAMGNIPSKTVDALSSAGEYGLRKAFGGNYEQPLDKIFERNSATTSEQIAVTKDAHPEAYQAGEVAGTMATGAVATSKAIKFIPESVLEKAKATTLGMNLNYSHSDFELKTPSNNSVAVVKNDNVVWR